MRGEEGGPVEGETDPTVDQEVGVCLGVEAGRDGMPAETGGPVGHGAERGGAGAERGGDIVESGGYAGTNRGGIAILIMYSKTQLIKWPIIYNGRNYFLFEYN